MFGQLYGKSISMRGAILGFPELDEFVLTPIDESDTISTFAYLQSVEEEAIGFLVSNPFQFYKDFELTLPEQDRIDIEANQPEDVVVLAILTIAEPFSASTVNLLAPLVINIHTLRGRQIVLPPDSPYTTKMALKPKAAIKEGES